MANFREALHSIRRISTRDVMGLATGGGTLVLAGMAIHDYLEKHPAGFDTDVKSTIVTGVVTALIEAPHVKQVASRVGRAIFRRSRV